MKSMLKILLVSFLMWASMHGNMAMAETTSSGTLPVSIVIDSKSMEINNKLKIVTFLDEVDAKGNDFNISCQKMVVFYKEHLSGKGENKSDKEPDENVKKEYGKLTAGEAKEAADKNSIIKIEAMGNVKIERNDGGVATSDKAVFYQEEEKIVLTGNPAVEQGNNFVKGDVITIFVKENRSIVESSGGNKVNATIFPKGITRATR